MTSIFQINKFPVDKMARMISITVSYMMQSIDIDYKDLNLKIIDNQLCFYYKKDDGDLIMPIARLSTIEKLKKNK